MTIVYLSYWQINDPLTISSAFPVLKHLLARDEIDKILLCTIERGNYDSSVLKKYFAGKNIVHIPLFSFDLGVSLLTKLGDFFFFPKKIIKLIKNEQANLLIARSSLAGAIALLVHKRVNIPFFVESFEPHADYMLESEVWSKFGIRYLLQKRWEKRQMELSHALMPVSENYQNYLIKEGVDIDKIRVVPCVLDHTKFEFKKEIGSETRLKIGFKNTDIVGIYVGKFGGIYYDDDAYKVFFLAQKFFGEDFRLILLTPEKKDKVMAKLKKHDFLIKNAYVDFVDISLVSNYLSASTFAFSTIKPSKSRKFCSPIKNGEYWANGLPILSPDGIGDDSEIIKKECGGSIFDLNDSENILHALNKIKKIIEEENHRKRISEISVKHRSLQYINEAYNYFFDSYGSLISNL